MAIPRTFLAVLLLFLVDSASADPQSTELRGDVEAIADARSMVENMGGLEIWAQLQSVHFVHEWDLYRRIDSYVENEILDLTASRSYVTMESEIYSRIRAYSPEHGYWNIVNGEFALASDEALAAAMERAPYNLYRIARAVAADDAEFEIRMGHSDEAPVGNRLEFYGSDGLLHGWIVLNARKEPLVWATTQYSYVFGPLKRFGNLYVPDWGVTGNGAARYQMVSLVGSRNPPDADLFVPPKQP